MKLSCWSAPVLLCLSMLLLGVRAGSSEELQPLEPAWLTDMYADGWQKVEEGVLQRDLGGGSRETFAYGTEGLEWIAQSYEKRIQRMEDRYSTLPSEELAKAIEGLKSRLYNLYQDIPAARSAESFSGEELTDCTPDVSGEAKAFPRESPRGVMATADVFYNGCGQVADIFLHTYADAIDGPDHSADTRDKNLPQESLITASVSATANGTSACQSDASVDVRVTGDSIYFREDEHYGCPLSVVVSIAGPTLVTTDHYTAPCKNATWTASASNGTPPYSYTWYIDGVSQGSPGPSLTKQYCGVDKTVTVKVVAKDDYAWTAEATTTTQVRHIGPVIASVSQSTVVNNTSACVDVTWTGSATGGHPGYTYSWYLGTDPAVQGTNSTLTKNFCTSQTVTGKLIARDSDGHTDEEPFTTQITPPPPPFEASIAGPATINTDYYDPNCTKVTWTASATAGHPGYTYSWYLGTSTTVQGTGTTFIKNYCPGDPKPLNVKVTARDSDGHTDDATFTTNVQDLGVIQVQIQGPTSVTTSTANPCVDVTWTGVASSVGHTGFTYQWYIGSEYVGSGSTFTKRYCNTSQTVSLMVLTRASDRHGGVTASHGTTITHQP